MARHIAQTARPLLAAFLLSGVAAPVSAVGAAPPAALAAAGVLHKLGKPSHHDRLRSAIGRRGEARIIVELRDGGPQLFHPGFSGGGAAGRRRAIAGLQDRVFDGGWLRRPGAVKRFRNLPFAALAVDSDELARLAAKPEVVSIQEDRRHRPSLDQSTMQVGAELAWASGYTGAGEAIAILDTGIESDHPALSGKVISEACYSTTYSGGLATSLCPDGANPGGADEQTGPGAGRNCAGSLSRCDHGTHVAGIAASDDALYPGVARGGDLIAIQVFSRFDDPDFCDSPEPCVGAYDSDIIRGLERVYELRDTLAIATVNLSLGGVDYETPWACDAANRATKAAIDNLRSVGIATVVAAGNGGSSRAVSSPACISSAVSVGAVTGADAVAGLSNTAWWLSALAPGAGITSAVPGAAFRGKSGTSMAAPHVAGTLALLRSAAPAAGLEDLLDAVTLTGVRVTDPGNGFSFPRVEVEAAVQALPVIDELRDVANLNLALEPIVSGLDRPVAITHAGDGSGRLFVAEQSGRVWVKAGNELFSEPFLDLSARISCCGSRGLLGLAFHPDHDSNGAFFVFFIDLDGDIVVSRYSVSGTNANVADPGSESVVLRVPRPAGGHFGGQLQFGPDGNLYIGIGDGSSGGTVVDTAGDLSTPLGKLLRLGVDGASPYVIPPDNPFVQHPQVLPEIWAFGLRNPWRFAFDRLTGDLYVADVGEQAFEEVNFQPVESDGAEDYGWNVMEGGECREAGCDTTGLVVPVAGYDHSEGCSITGGSVYRATEFASLQGVYFYGDFCRGTVRGLRRDGNGWHDSRILETPLSISTFGEDEAGNLYLADHQGGNVYKLKASSLRLETASLPDAAVGSAYEAALTTSGGVGPFTWAVVEGDLPQGLVLDPTSGGISGSPVGAGLSAFWVQVEDANHDNVPRALSILVEPSEGGTSGNETGRDFVILDALGDPIGNGIFHLDQSEPLPPGEYAISELAVTLSGQTGAPFEAATGTLRVKSSGARRISGLLRNREVTFLARRPLGLGTKRLRIAANRGKLRLRGGGSFELVHRQITVIAGTYEAPAGEPR